MTEHSGIARGKSIRDLCLERTIDYNRQYGYSVNTPTYKCNCLLRTHSIIFQFKKQVVFKIFDQNGNSVLPFSKKSHVSKIPNQLACLDSRLSSDTTTQLQRYV